MICVIMNTQHRGVMSKSTAVQERLQYLARTKLLKEKQSKVKLRTKLLNSFAK